MTIPLPSLLTIPTVLLCAIRQQQTSRRNWAWAVYGHRLASGWRLVWASSGHIDLDAK